MSCAWQEFLNLLPFWLRNEVDILGSASLQELRIRCGLPPELILAEKRTCLSRPISQEDIHFIVNAASQYSPWSAATAAQGYISAPGGHRIGICGEAVLERDMMTGIKNAQSLCLRVARDFPGISYGLPTDDSSVLIIGRPGSGKTTLLRDMIRRRSEAGPGSVSVVDERGELFPVACGKSCFPPGKRTDVLRFCPKRIGITTALRTMGPSCVAVDEITQEDDCNELLRAGWSGVSLLATAHAGNKRDLLSRPVYRPILEMGLFDTLVIMQPDKSWKVERM